MPRRRLALIALTCCALLATPGTHAGADPKHPSQQELDAATARVGSAQRVVSSLEIRAEAAAEAYNGAVTRRQQAARASAQADGKAVAARSQARQSAEQAAAASRLSAVATSRAATAHDQQAAAEAEVAAARQDLAQFANAAYRTGGELTMAIQLMDARSPLELAQGHDLMNSVSVYQQDTVDRMATAQRLAAQRTVIATQARAAAATALDQAAAALRTAGDAADTATASSQAAAVANRQAAQAVAAAVAAKTQAQTLVAQAEDALGSAKVTAASLQRAAVQARLEAARVRAAMLAAARAAASRSRSQGGSTSTRASTGSSAAQTAISWAFQEIGVPYSWGGGDESGPTYGFAQGAGIRGFDCSGLTLFAYGHAGIHLDHYTGSQYNQGKRISSYGDLQPGDLMFFATDTSNEATIHHVAIYLGGGRMIEAPHTGDVVKVSPARSGDFIGATRPWA